MSRTRTVSGVITTAALVLLFGNQAVTEWVARHTDPGSVWGWFLRQLTWPAWAFGPRDDSAGAGRAVLADDLKALLLIAFVAAILAMVASSISGGSGGFILGWASLIFASALAAFLTAFIISSPTFIGALERAAAGSTYGLFVGWIVGITTAGGKKQAG
jgi:hypothetical protein